MNQWIYIWAWRVRATFPGLSPHQDCDQQIRNKEDEQINDRNARQKAMKRSHILQD